MAIKNEKGLFIKSGFTRIPRKKKKKIPKDTFYCYTPLTKPGIMEDGQWGYKIKTCPYLDWIKVKDMSPSPSYLTNSDIDEFGENEVTWCKLIKYEIDDQCKSCGSRLGLKNLLKNLL